LQQLANRAIGMKESNKTSPDSNPCKRSRTWIIVTMEHAVSYSALEKD
jgi:hypothetical protein